MAQSQFVSLERKLLKQDALKSKYIQFLKDYLVQGHMRKPYKSDETKRKFYLPHHAVTKNSDPGGKIRVVFNASAKTDSGYSLNDSLLSGPKLQEELWLVLSRWTCLEFVFTANIVQMFRQINVCEDDQNLQRILWRENTSSAIQEFVLTTVTYGTALAPYLDMRTLLQLAQDEEPKFPCGVEAVRKHKYVDDFFFGGHTLLQEDANRQQLIRLLEAGAFSLSKWAANHPQLCSESEVTERLFVEDRGVSTLGVLWSAKQDNFRLRATPQCTTEGCTKRTVLSDVARFFDLCGWATPVLIYGRIFLQEIWKRKLGWDEPLPDDLCDQWTGFVSILTEMCKISVPRYIKFSREKCKVSLIGFSDASEKAFAAVIYMRCATASNVFVNIVVAKSKVAPLTVTSIPRLELCGALLLAKLMKITATGLDLPIDSWHLWTDAQVVLHWMQSHPSRWLPFVAHRVSAIQEIVSADRWKHVSTDQNPADLATRGITVAELSESTLWWHGPSWLSLPYDEWPQHNATLESNAPAFEEAAKHVLVCSHEDTQNELLTRYSMLNRLIRIVAVCLRFIQNVRGKDT